MIFTAQRGKSVKMDRRKWQNMEEFIFISNNLNKKENIYTKEKFNLKLGELLYTAGMLLENGWWKVVIRFMQAPESKIDFA